MAQRRGFTLVELLVVMGIIALLLAMLVPTVNTARRAAKVAACAANLHAIGQAIHLYADRSHGELPYGFFTFGAATVSWDDLINRDLGGNMTSEDAESPAASRPMNVMVCPEDDVQRVLPGWGGPIWPRSYAMIRRTTAVETDGVDFAGVAGSYQTSGTECLEQISLPITRIRRPAETFMVSEAPCSANVLGNASYSLLDSPDQQTRLHPPPHRKRANYLYVDGHVALFAPGETVGPAGTSGAPAGSWSRIAAPGGTSAYYYSAK